MIGSLPRPVLDHVVVNARANLDEAARCYAQLGFRLSPLSRHTLGSINRLAVLAQDYLELVGIDPDAAAPRRELLDSPAGLNGLVFATEDADAVYRTLAARGQPVAAPVEFSRPVATAAGEETARFRVVRVAAERAPYGRVYFCQHLTRDLVWRAADQSHANGVNGIVRVVIASSDPAATGALYRGLFGDGSLAAMPGGLVLAMGGARLEILTPQALAAAFGPAAPPAQGRDAFMAALGFRSRSLDPARRVLGVLARDEGSRLVIAAAVAFGLALEFVE